MNKEEFINFLYYLLDKIDTVYYEEVSHSIEKFITRINKYFR